MDDREERRLRMEWFREALRQVKKKRYAPTPEMIEIDDAMGFGDKDPMLDYASQANETWVDLSVFSEAQRKEIIEHFIPLSKTKLKYGKGKDYKYLIIATSMPDGSGTGEALWMVVIPYLEKYVVVG